MYSAFPGGWPGAGLFLLRIVVGSAVLAQGGVCLLSQRTPQGTLGEPVPFGVMLLGVIGVATGAALLAGFLTPVAAGVVSLGSAGVVLARLHLGAVDIPAANSDTFFIVVIAAAIAVLGPGTWSVDAWLFGRREIVIPPESRRSP